jgi:hypothetical protein
VDQTGQSDRAVPAHEPELLAGFLFAQTSPQTSMGVVTTAEPSSLSLLAAGVAGIPARRARLERLKKISS